MLPAQQLIAAVGEDQVDLVKTLLSKDFQAQDLEQAFAAAVNRANLEIVQLLLSDDRFDASVVVDSSLLKRLTENKHEDLIALLLQDDNIVEKVVQERAAAKRKQSATKQSPSHLAALASSQDELDSSLSDAGPGNVAESQDLQVETSAPDSPTPPSRTDSPVDTKDVQISQLTTKLAETTLELQELKDKFQKFESFEKKKVQEFITFTELLKSLQERVESEKKLRADLQETISKIENRVTARESEANPLNLKLKEMNTRLTGLSEQIQKDQSSAKHHQLGAAMEALQNRIFLQENGAAQIVKQQEALTDQLAELNKLTEKEYSNYKLKTSEIEKSLSGLQNNFARYSQTTQDLQTRVEQVENTTDRVQTLTESLKSSILSNSNSQSPEEGVSPLSLSGQHLESLTKLSKSVNSLQVSFDELSNDKTLVKRVQALETSNQAIHRSINELSEPKVNPDILQLENAMSALGIQQLNFSRTINNTIERFESRVVVLEHDTMTSKNKVVEIAGIVMELKDITNELKVELSTKQAVLGLENKQLAKQLLQLDQDYKASESGALAEELSKMAGAIGHLKKAHNTLAARIRQGEQQKGLGGGEEMTEHLVTVVESLRDLKEKQLVQEMINSQTLVKSQKIDKKVDDIEIGFKRVLDDFHNIMMFSREPQTGRYLALQDLDEVEAQEIVPVPLSASGSHQHHHSHSHSHTHPHVNPTAPVEKPQPPPVIIRPPSKPDTGKQPQQSPNPAKRGPGTPVKKMPPREFSPVLPITNIKSTPDGNPPGRRSPRKESARVPKPPKQQPEILQEEEGPDTPTKAPTPTQEQPKDSLTLPSIDIWDDSSKKNYESFLDGLPIDEPEPEPEPQPVLKPPVQADQSPKSPMRESKQRKASKAGHSPEISEKKGHRASDKNPHDTPGGEGKKPGKKKGAGGKSSSDSEGCIQQ